MDYREEKDTMGTVRVPDSVYYGAQTQRAVDNFPISSLRLQPSFIRAQAIIKAAAAEANGEAGVLDPAIGRAIVRAAGEVRRGAFDDQFVVDVFQAGAGTSQNMNMNEVIANRAEELLGGKKGAYKLVHPNDHVNMSQSTNDTVHAAIHIAAVMELTDASASKGVRAQIHDLASGVRGVLDVHAVRTRTHAGVTQVDMHIMVDPEISVHEGHDIADLVKREVELGVPDVEDVLVHVEPFEEVHED